MSMYYYLIVTDIGIAHGGQYRDRVASRITYLQESGYNILHVTKINKITHERKILTLKEFMG